MPKNGDIEGKNGTFLFNVQTTEAILTQHSVYALCWLQKKNTPTKEQTHISFPDAGKLAESQGPRQLSCTAALSKSVMMVDSAVQVILCECPPLEKLSPQTGFSSCKQSTSVQTQSPSKPSPKKTSDYKAESFSSILYQIADKIVSADKIGTNSKSKKP
jgi:hypothetical protein